MTAPDLDQEPGLNRDQSPPRPIGLTAACVTGWLLIAAAGLRILARWDALEKLPAPRAGAAIAALVLLGIALLGYWRLRRWGIWILAFLVAARLAASAAGALPFQASDIGLPVLLLGIGLIYWRRLG